MTQDRKGSKKIEILAPAGSYGSFMAAVTAGADAVYAGGPRFGARAYAKNFSKEQMLADYEDEKAWEKKMLVNIAKAGFFSSDRTIAEYNRDIWHL